MDSLTNSERILHGSLYCLTFVTGLVDAGSYVAMGHVFTANMTGNIVFLGFALGGVPGLSIGRSATALGFFLAGGLLARKLDSLWGKPQRDRWLAAAFAIETLLLFGAMTLSWYLEPRGGQYISTALYGIIALTALGMGLRNGTVRRLAVPELTTTVLTLHGGGTGVRLFTHARQQSHVAPPRQLNLDDEFGSICRRSTVKALPGAHARHLGHSDCALFVGPNLPRGSGPLGEIASSATLADLVHAYSLIKSS